MYREIAGTDERVRAIPGVRDRQVRATKVRLYSSAIRWSIVYIEGSEVIISKKKLLYFSLNIDFVLLANSADPYVNAVCAISFGYSLFAKLPV